MPGKRSVGLALLVGWIAGAAHLSAHRLDEYLQATRLSVAVDRVNLEIDLTPGTGVAAEAISWMDTDRDGLISAAESSAYARDVLGSVVLVADGRRAHISLVESQYPDLSDMTEGVGTIRLRATAEISAAAPGRHVVTYVNAHRSDTSVYLANALVPSDPRVTIATQRRDPAQRELTLEYDVAQSAWLRILSVAGGLGLVAVIGLARRCRTPATSRTAC